MWRSGKAGTIGPWAKLAKVLDRRSRGPGFNRRIPIVFDYLNSVRILYPVLHNKLKKKICLIITSKLCLRSCRTVYSFDEFLALGGSESQLHEVSKICRTVDIDDPCVALFTTVCIWGKTIFVLRVLSFNSIQYLFHSSTLQWNTVKVCKTTV